MDRDCLLGLDVGTQGVKGVVVTTDGQLLAQARCEHGTSQPRPGWSEQDPETAWWGDGKVIIRQLLSQTGVEAARIAAVGVTGLTPCLALLDESGCAPRPAILYNDNRALDQLTRVNRECGLSLTAQAILPKWLWLAENEPDVLAHAHAIVSSYNYVVHRLTGAVSMDYDTASIVGGVFDAATRQWDLRPCARLGLDARLLPPPCPATSIAGGITEAAARATGLVAGTPVMVGTGDTFASLLGCGAVDAGDAAIILGTTGLLTLTLHPLERVAAGPHFEGSAPDGGVAWVANLLASGQVQTWFRAQLAPALKTVRPSGLPGESAGDFYARLDQEAGQVPAGSQHLIALPHWLGRRTPTPDPNARGVLFGLTTAHTAAHIYRALLESVGYAFRQGFDVVRPRIKRVVVTAGAAASALLRQILADVLETGLEYHPLSGGAVGIAFMAGYAAGVIPDFRAIKTAWLVDPLVVRPQPSAVETYRRLYPVYCFLDQALEPAFAMLQRGESTPHDP
jgi:xylulokinase